MQHLHALDAAFHRLHAAFAGGRASNGLLQAMAYALFSGGARLRPQLSLAIAADAGANWTPALPLACAVELLHAASLVHDDLPCFDDAATRRHRPTVHRQFGEATAVLTGDALLTLAFRAVGDLAAVAAGVAPAAEAATATTAVTAASAAGAAWVARAATALLCGQSTEQEPAPLRPSLAAYHQDKTGCLFEAAAAGGAAAAGLPQARWAAFGRAIGAAYQIADDLHDVASAAGTQHQPGFAGKPVGRDAALNRPNYALCHGVEATRQTLAKKLAQLKAEAASLDGGPALRAWLAALDVRLGASASAHRRGERAVASATPPTHGAAAGSAASSHAAGVFAPAAFP